MNRAAKVRGQSGHAVRMISMMMCDQNADQLAVGPFQKVKNGRRIARIDYDGMMRVRVLNAPDIVILEGWNGNDLQMRAV